MFFKKKKKNEEKINVEIYNENDYKAVEESIINNFGKFDNVFHELVSDVVHIDINIIEPSLEKDYYTLVTCGVGAKKMNFSNEYCRIELMIHLPKTWDIKSNDEKWYWPIRLLKTLGRFAFLYNTWLGQGHTLEFDYNFFKDTDFFGVILDRALDFNGNYPKIYLEDKTQLHFLQVIPIFKNELNWKMENDADSLLEKLQKIEFDYVIYPNRNSII